MDTEDVLTNAREDARKEVKRLEQKHAEGYKKRPIASGEFSDLYAEQDLSGLEPRDDERSIFADLLKSPRSSANQTSPS